MDKRNHTVTVPREYIEELEAFKEMHEGESAKNLRGVIRIVSGFDSRLSPPHSGEIRSARLKSASVLFLDDDNISRVDGIIIMDEQGFEKASFARTSFL